MIYKCMFILECRGQYSGTVILQANFIFFIPRLQFVAHMFVNHHLNESAGNTMRCCLSLLKSCTL